MVYNYEIFLVVHYQKNGENRKSSGKYIEFKTISQALSFYEQIPERPPLFYQQLSNDKNSIRDDVMDNLSNFKPNKQKETHDLSIGVSHSDPSINQLIFKDKKKTGGIYVIYGIGALLTLFYFVFCFMTKTGVKGYIPFSIAVGVLVIFLIVRLSTLHSDFKRKPLSGPALEIKVENT
jgi:hypothetical protein